MGHSGGGQLRFTPMRQSRKHPVTYLEKDGVFPNGPFRFETPREVFLAAALAIRLNNTIGNESIRYVAKIAGLSPQTILNILSGKSWPDLRTIARLEAGMRTRLWGMEHRKRYR